MLYDYKASGIVTSTAAEGDCGTRDDVLHSSCA